MDNMDQVVEMCRKAVNDIILSVGGVGNLLQNENKMALIQAIGNRLTQLGADVDAVMGTLLANAYMQGITDGDAFLQSQGMDTSVTGFNKQIHLAGVQSIVADTMQDMNASFRTALAMAITNIDDILAEVNEDIAKGMILGDPSDAVSRRVEQTFAKNGMTSFITIDGKHLPLDFYAQTVTRTKYRVAHTTGAVNRYKENGVNHVKINEHHPTCSKCAKYQGKVLALDPNDAQGFPVADVDVPLPPYHPNCQHTARPFVMDYHSMTDIKNEKKKWNSFDPDHDPRTEAQKNLYKNEQDIRRKARAEMKEYDLMKATLKGDDLAKLPKTLGAYRRMKRKNDQAWIDLQQSYKDNIALVNGTGPGPGTPRKKKGSKTGASGTPAPVKKQTKQTSTKKAKQTTQTPPSVSTVSTDISGLNFKPDASDQKSFDAFDQVIDGIELTDRRKASKHILASIPNSIPVKIQKISANGWCSMTVRGGKINIEDFVLQSLENRPIQYQWKTMFHEFYHANMNGLDKPKHGFDAEWTMWEETATECSAFFMSKRVGINIDNISPSYPEHLIETLPALKTLPEFADCVDMNDFGAKFMKYRFDPNHATASWEFLEKKIGKKYVNKDQYFVDHYKDHIANNVDRYVDMIFESLQQEKMSQEQVIKGMIKRGIETGIRTGKVNREIKMALPTAMNEVGIKPM